MSRPSLLISRSSKDAQVFLDKIKDRFGKVEAHSFIEFNPVLFDKEIDTEWLFFYSQKGVDFFLKEKVQFEGKVAAFGPATATRLEDNNIKTHFVGSGQAESTAAAWNPTALNSSVTFIKGERSLDSMRTYLDDSIKVESRIVYRQVLKRSAGLEEFDFLVFTSPLNFEGYLSGNQILPHQKVLAIGTTTACAIINQIDHPVHIAKHPSMTGLADLALSIAKG